MLYSKGKLADEETPSALTSSVERGDTRPPISNMASPSPVQHWWEDLASTKLTEVSLQDPLIGSSLMQDRSTPYPCLSYPPQRSPGLPQCVWLDIFSGRSGRRQEWWVWGLNTSTLLPTDSLGLPPVIIIPRNKCIYYFSVYKFNDSILICTESDFNWGELYQLTLYRFSRCCCRSCSRWC